MFKRLDFKGLNYRDLDRYDAHDLKRDEIQSFYMTFDFLDLIKKWPTIVGVKLAPVTSPLKISGGALFVITKHSIYSQELSFLVEPIKTEIFKVFPNLRPVIKKIMFQTQEKFFEAKAETSARTAETRPVGLHPQSPQFKLRKAEAERLFADIEDADLRNVMVSIYIQS